ncbi:MAG TPA: hypothetical protein VLI41_16265 [Phenylobacterium sp.]|uniref:hypothetical protein n=1 Tax=Phenylobacterium sp. TaxID=1871053 RepID=UPI002CEA833D|nr:hypothetical protein [Phenylobacterium sp.]HSV04752.1 hypothetical protein [Phenylobacterium sp.]
MRRTRSWAAIAIGTAALIALAGCGKPKVRAPASSEGRPPIATAQAPKAGQPAWSPPPAKTSTAALPAEPGWAGALLGKQLKTALPATGGDCVGNTDLVDFRYVGATPGVLIEGWGWDKAAKQAVARVILVDKDGQIVGGGETGTPRPDVSASQKAVTSSTTGWKAVTPVTTGVLRAFGMTGDGQATCPLGQIDLGH